MSILETAKVILQKVPAISLKDLVSEVNTTTGKSTASIRGVICKDTVGVYNTSFLQSIGKTYQEGVFTSAPTKPHQNYDCKEKQRVRTKLFGYIPKHKDAVVLTMASYEGLCVKHIKAMRPTAKIINVEMDLEVLREYKKLKLGTTDCLNTIEEFVEQNPTIPIDFAFIDTVGYLSQKSEDLYTALNTNKNIKVLAITQQFMEDFRNNPKNKWRVINDAKYAKHDKKVTACMDDLLSNYTRVEDEQYRKENVKHAQKMRTFVFVRKD